MVTQGKTLNCGYHRVGEGGMMMMMIISCIIFIWIFNS